MNLAEQYLPIEHRSSYFGTPGYEDTDMRVGIAGPNFHEEDIVYLLEGMGLRLNFGQPLPGAPVISLNRTETETHQQLELTISKDARQLASYRTSDRMHFTDELGGGDFRLHLGHITKNSLWNWLLRFNEPRESQPLSNLIKAAIHVSTESVPVPTFEVRPETRAAALATFDEGIYSEARGRFFDCAHPDQPYVSGSALRHSGA